MSSDMTELEQIGLGTAASDDAALQPLHRATVVG